MKKNVEKSSISQDSNKVRDFIVESITLDFPMFKNLKVAQFDKVGEALAGFCLTEEGYIYGFSIEKNERPFLQRYLPQDDQ